MKGVTNDARDRAGSCWLTPILMQNFRPGRACPSPERENLQVPEILYYTEFGDF
jgi:hypothetical protein